MQLRDKTLPDKKFFTVNDDLITVVQNINWLILFENNQEKLFPLERKNFSFSKVFPFSSTHLDFSPLIQEWKWVQLKGKTFPDEKFFTETSYCERWFLTYSANKKPNQSSNESKNGHPFSIKVRSWLVKKVEDELSGIIKGRSKTTLAIVCLLLTTYPSPFESCERIFLLKCGKICIYIYADFPNQLIFNFLNPIPTRWGRNQPLYERHVTKSVRNKVKSVTVNRCWNPMWI